MYDYLIFHKAELMNTLDNILLQVAAWMVKHTIIAYCYYSVLPRNLRPGGLPGLKQKI